VTGDTASSGRTNVQIRDSQENPLAKHMRSGNYTFRARQQNENRKFHLKDSIVNRCTTWLLLAESHLTRLLFGGI
jgi:hypothetical protein